jgi:hypothetical protein
MGAFPFSGWLIEYFDLEINELKPLMHISEGQKFQRLPVPFRFGSIRLFQNSLYLTVKMGMHL